MIAPVLARLDAIPGVASVRVDCSGSFFLLTARDAAALERAWPAARDALGPTAAPVEGQARADQLATLARGEPWFGSANLRALSCIEARVLAGRMHDAIAARVPLDPGTAAGVLEACRLEILAALDHAHDTGGRASTTWFWKAWPAVVVRISARLAALLEDGGRAAAEAALLEQAPRR